MPEAREVFRSEALLVRQVGNFGSTSCVVTFDSFTDNCTLDRPGFGEHFLAHRAIDAFHVISRDNIWYQHPEMPAAMGAVHAATRGYARVVTYGSSMGAYGAIRFAGWVGADCALACSPQFSIDPAVVPFEYRWEEPARAFLDMWEGQVPLPALRDAYVAFDPEDLDAKHIALFEQAFRFTPVRLPGAGHPVTGFLHEVQLLDRLVMAVIRGDCQADVAELIDEAWSRRERSAQYLCQCASREWRRSRKIALLVKAVALSQGHGDVRAMLATQLALAGRLDEAVAAFELALAKEPEHPNVLLHYSKTMERQGDIAQAFALTERALAQSGNLAFYGPRIEFLRRHIGTTPRRRWRSVLGAFVGRAIDVKKIRLWGQG